MWYKLTIAAYAFALPTITVLAIGQDACVAFTSGTSTLPIVKQARAAPILTSPDEWPGVQLAAFNFATDIQRVTGVKPVVTNFTAPASGAANGVIPVIVGTLGKSTLINQVVSAAQLDVSSIQGKWESFLAREVVNPLPGVSRAYVIIGADKRGTIFALYDHSEQFGVSPWWADVPITKHTELYVNSSGCSHGSPTVKYRGIFINDEQPALQSWALEKFTNGTTGSPLGSPFDHLFYTKLFELMLRMKANYLWPAMWGSAFAVDDDQNQFLADMYGIVMGTSHQEPMMRSTPNEFSLYGKGTWDYVSNTQNIQDYWIAGAQRAKPYESVYTLGMRGFGDLPLSEETNIQLLQQVVADQSNILKSVYGNDVENKEVEGYYDAGMKVPDYVTLLWTDDNWGNIRRFPLASERKRSGGAGVYYHVDYVGDPRDYKWITSSQISKIYEQMSIAFDREATRVWIVNVGDLKPYERETEFFITLGWNSTRWSPNNLDAYVSSWAQREFGISPAVASTVADIVGNLTRFNARRKPELLNTTTYSLINYREAENVLTLWANLKDASTKIYDSLPSDAKLAFFQLVHHPVLASANVANLLSTNALADQAVKFFEEDFDLETQYHQLLDGQLESE
ncbi:hypothetical protein H0H81_009389 [Sphagnurus paluster]|uniref:Glycoside hydrolase family 115 protein n=1 Tax=Sphagnurus paluster TaxID=117069 RepID=A0A9P7FPP0_9AGAR|nr:hypothetical protein H0H81_009389 [Sphagnurus paluster]